MDDTQSCLWLQVEAREEQDGGEDERQKMRAVGEGSRKSEGREHKWRKADHMQDGKWRRNRLRCSPSPVFSSVM